MLKIYDKREDVPETLLEHYNKRGDGKFEPSVEGINSIGGLLAKRDELLDKVKEIPQLKTRVSELEGQEVLTAGKVAVDKTEFDTLKTENESYKSLGNLDEIKPKVEGYDALKTETETARKRETLTKAFAAAGITNLSAAFNLKQSDSLNIESETKDGKEVFYAVTTDDKGKTDKKVFDGEFIKEADGFKDILPALSGKTGTAMFKQGSGSPTDTKTAVKDLLNRRYNKQPEKTA